MSSSRAEFKLEEAKLRLVELNQDRAVRAMAETILSNSRILAPRLWGKLRGSGHVEGSDASYAVVYGGESVGVPYARYQEYGNPLWHYTTAGTGPQYLHRAGDAVMRQGIKEFLK